MFEKQWMGFAPSSFFHPSVYLCPHLFPCSFPFIAFSFFCSPFPRSLLPGPSTDMSPRAIASCHDAVCLKTPLTLSLCGIHLSISDLTHKNTHTLKRQSCRDILNRSFSKMQKANTEGRDLDFCLVWRDGHMHRQLNEQLQTDMWEIDPLQMTSVTILQISRTILLLMWDISHTHTPQC